MLSLVLACVAVAATAADNPPPKRAGIVSLLGESPQWVVIGAAAAPGVSAAEPVQKWEIDYFVETVVGRHVSAHGLDPIVPDKAARAALPSVEEFARRERLDVIVTVTPASRPTQFKDSTDRYAGYGRWSREDLVGCFASIQITVTDAKDGKVLKQESESRGRRLKGRETAGRRLPQLSETQALEARECMEDLLETVQDLALRRMGY